MCEHIGYSTGSARFGVMCLAGDETAGAAGFSKLRAMFAGLNSGREISAVFYFVPSRLSGGPGLGLGALCGESNSRNRRR